MGKSLENLKEHFALKGHLYLIIFTIMEVLYFIAYTLVYVFSTTNSEVDIS